MFGIDPARKGPVPATCPWTSIGFSQRCCGEGDEYFPGNRPLPAHGTVPVLSGANVNASFEPGCLQTVVSPTTRVRVFCVGGSTCSFRSLASAGSSTMIDP